VDAARTSASNPSGARAGKTDQQLLVTRGGGVNEEG
jgi:hypothetical protein